MLREEQSFREVYDAGSIERLMKVEATIDARTEKGLSRLFILREHKRSAARQVEYRSGSSRGSKQARSRAGADPGDTADNDDTDEHDSDDDDEGPDWEHELEDNQ